MACLTTHHCALALLPPATFIFGLSAALGLTVFFWLAVRSGWRAAHLVRALMLGMITGYLGQYLIDEATHLILPRGLLWAWLSSLPGG